MTKTPEFKREAVHGLRCINEFGHYYTVDGIYAKSIRNLVSLLGISTSTLYRWDSATDFITLTPDQFVPTFEEELEEAYEEAEEVPLIDVNAFIDRDRAIDELNAEFDEPEPTMSFKMGTTFFQTLAQGLGVKNYRMPLEQLYLKIGTELIKMSGLVETGVKEELRV